MRPLADCLGADVEFALRNIERDPLREMFDYVLCLNLLHYDFMGPFMRGAMVHERDEANDILTTAEKITFVTV